MHPNGVQWALLG